MSVEFTLPDIGEGLHEAEVVSWLVAVGDTVERNQPFVEIMTDKSTVEMPAPAAGTVRLHGAAEGEMIQVGDVLVVIDEHPDDSAPIDDAPTDEASNDHHRSENGRGDTRPIVTESVTAEINSKTGQSPSVRRPKASPSTRRLAAELAVDLSSITGTGPGGRILAEDVRTAAADGGQDERSASTPVPPPLPASARVSAGGPSPDTDTSNVGAQPDQPAPVVPPLTGPQPGGAVSGTAMLEPGVHKLRGVRRATARAMDQSWSTIPHINAFNEINAEHLLSTRAQLKAFQRPDEANITPLVLALMAVARALRAHPVMNAGLDLDAETITVHERVNIGVAVATDYGLVVPIIADADGLGVAAMAEELRRLTTAARNRTMGPEDVRGGTYTVTNFGSHGTYLANPIIRPGETGICGLGSIAERPIVIDGTVVARPTLPVVACGDHRLVDGDVLSSFHSHVCRSLEAPLGLLL